MGKTEKRRGANFEYWVAERLRSLGWDANRNPLSGGSVQISKHMGKNDVRAFKKYLTLFIECKKTSKSQITLHKLWFDKLGEVRVEDGKLVVEPLVFAFQPEAGLQLEPVVCLPLEEFMKLIDIIGNFYGKA